MTADVRLLVLDQLAEHDAPDLPVYGQTLRDAFARAVSPQAHAPAVRWPTDSSAGGAGAGETVEAKSGVAGAMDGPAAPATGGVS